MRSYLTWRLRSLVPQRQRRTRPSTTRVDTELSGRIGTDNKAERRFLTRILYAGRVEAIERPIVVVTRTADKADRLLVTLAGVYCSGGELHQTGPMATVQRDLADLARTDFPAEDTLCIPGWRSNCSMRCAPQEEDDMVCRFNFS